MWLAAPSSKMHFPSISPAPHPQLLKTARQAEPLTSQHGPKTPCLPLLPVGTRGFCSQLRTAGDGVQAGRVLLGTPRSRALCHLPVPTQAHCSGSQPSEGGTQCRHLDLLSPVPASRPLGLSIRLHWVCPAAPRPPSTAHPPQPHLDLGPVRGRPLSAPGDRAASADPVWVCSCFTGPPRQCWPQCQSGLTAL